MTEQGKAGGAWPTLRKVLAALGLHPFFAFDRDKRGALLDLRDALDEIEALRARVERLEGVPPAAAVVTLVAGDTVPTLGAYRAGGDAP